MEQIIAIVTTRSVSYFISFPIANLIFPTVITFFRMYIHCALNLLTFTKLRWNPLTHNDPPPITDNYLYIPASIRISSRITVFNISWMLYINLFSIFKASEFLKRGYDVVPLTDKKDQPFSMPFLTVIYIVVSISHYPHIILYLWKPYFWSF